MMDKITEDTTLAEILELPESNSILAKYSLPCLYCPMAVYERGMLKIGEVAKTYGLDLKNLLEELNRI